MKTVNVLWLDDDFAHNSPSYDRLYNYRMRLMSLLENDYDINLQIRECISGSDATAILLDEPSQFDLSIIDLELDDQVTPTGFKVLERINNVKRSRSVVILSDHVPGKNEQDNERFGEKLKAFKYAYLNAFKKTEEGIQELAKFIHVYVEKPSVSFVVLSDIHSGFITRENKRAQTFEKALLKELKNTARHHKPNYLIATGDFAWKSQQEDLPRASSLINKIRTELGLRGDKQFHFCPGNHDVSLKGNENWLYYHDFVTRLAEVEPNIIKRFKSFEWDSLEEFRSSRDICSISTGIDENVLFVSLNSVDLRKVDSSSTKFDVTPCVGEQQWQYLKRKLSSIAAPKNQLRIALLHHPLYPPPAADNPVEEKILEDQAKALQILNDMGFQVIVHGHTHFPCIHEHRRTVLNSSVNSKPISRKILTIAAPTLGGEPSAAAPLRQYMIVQIGFFDPDKKSRSVSILTRIYNPEDETWHDGTSIASGQYIVE